MLIVLKTVADTISIHALVKRATTQIGRPPNYLYISIHALVKRATEFLTKDGYLSDISIHALVKRATSSTILPYCGSFYFNPRPREEGDHQIHIEYAFELISIHALVKRATTADIIMCGIMAISIHALVKRATVIKA